MQHELHKLFAVLHILEISDIIPLSLHLFHDGENRAKDIQISGGAHVALIWRERKDGNAHFLLRVLLLGQTRPLERTIRQELHTVRKRNGAARCPFASGIDDRLDGAVNLGERHLERHLHGVEPKLTRLPLLVGLEHERHSDDVGHVKLLERRDGLGMVLRRRPADKGEAGQVDHRIHCAVIVAVEVFVDGSREIQAARVDTDHFAPTGLKLRDEGDVVILILGVDVALL